MTTRQRAHHTKEKKASRLSSLEPWKQDLLAAGLLYLVTLVLFRGIVFDNGAFSTEGDTAAAEAFAQAGRMIEEREGIDPLWMPNFFSGMPTFGNVAYLPHDVSYVQRAVVAVGRIILMGYEQYKQVVWLQAHRPCRLMQRTTGTAYLRPFTLSVHHRVF